MHASIGVPIFMNIFITFYGARSCRLKLVFFASFPQHFLFPLQTISLKTPYTTMCEDQKLPGIKAYTIAACNNYCKEINIAKKCNCRAFYMEGMKGKAIFVFSI